MAKRSFSTASVSDVCPAMLMCAGLRAGNTGGVLLNREIASMV